MTTFDTPDGPPLVRAASLALAFMRATKAPNWEAFVASVNEDPAAVLGQLRVTPEQLELMNEHRDAIAMMKVDSPALTLAVCPVCSRFSIVAAQPPATCNLKLGCTGKPIRVSAAVKTKPAGKATTAAPELEDEPFGDSDEPASADAAARVDVHVRVHLS